MAVKKKSSSAASKGKSKKTKAGSSKATTPGKSAKKRNINVPEGMGDEFKDAKNGRFVKGNKFGRVSGGHHHSKRYRDCFNKVVTNKVFSEVVAALSRKAKTGDARAGDLILTYGVGRSRKERIDISLDVKEAKEERDKSLNFWRSIIFNEDVTIDQKMKAQQQVDLILGHIKGDAKAGTADDFNNAIEKIENGLGISNTTLSDNGANGANGNEEYNGNGDADTG